MWRRLELPGDIVLPRLHEVIQAAMGWPDSHLHRFRTGNDHRSPYFITQYDRDEGEDGVLEDDIRLDQLVAAEGDGLWYEYDFGDGWDHALRVEAVLDAPPATVRCIGGRMACPPEDCGGLGGYAELADWVRTGYDEALLPDVFDSAAHGRDWLPTDWHPDHFDVEEINAALAVAVAEPVAVTGELAELSERLERRGARCCGRCWVARPRTDRPMSRVARGRPADRDLPCLPRPSRRRGLADRRRLPTARPGRAVRRTQRHHRMVDRQGQPRGPDPPVAAVRNSARALGLVSVRKGRLTPTAAGTRCRNDARALWQHIVGRLPLGTKTNERDAGWMALAVAGSGTPAQEWRSEISDLLYALGWRSGADRHSHPPADSLTLDVLEQLVGAAWTGWRLTGTDLAVAASARAVTRRGEGVIRPDGAGE